MPVEECDKVRDNLWNSKRFIKNLLGYDWFVIYILYQIKYESIRVNELPAFTESRRIFRTEVYAFGRKEVGEGSCTLFQNFFFHLRTRSRRLTQPIGIPSQGFSLSWSFWKLFFRQGIWSWSGQYFLQLVRWELMIFLIISQLQIPISSFFPPLLSQLF